MNKMRKFNSSIDIIPLQGVSNEDIMSPMGNKSQMDDQMRLQRDPQIISRVQMYLYENEDKVYIDVNEMADSLQRKYRDYRAKKRSAFRALVRRAYDEITESFSKKSDSLSRQDEYDDEVEIESDTPGNDTLGRELIKMYKKSVDEMNGNGSDKELIDISSDDDSEKVEDIAPEKSQQFAMSSEQTSGKSGSKSSSSGSKAKLSKPEQAKKEDINHQKPAESSEVKSSGPDKSRKRPREKTADGSPSGILKKKKESQAPVETKIKFADIGGNKKVLEDVCRLLVHIKHPEIFKQLGMSPPRGFLLHGPPGCGKTLLAHAVAGELDIPLIKVAAPELVGGVSGESESRIRELFDRATATAPCVLFLDEVDAMAPHRATAQKEMERRMVAQLLSCLDDLGTKENGDKVLVIGATNRPESLDPALRRAGRFDREVSLGIPDKESRACILQVHAAKLSLANDVDIKTIASLTPGFVGADLVALLREAAIAAVDRVFKALKKETSAIHPMTSSDKSADKVPEKADSEEAEKSVDKPTEKEPEKSTTDEPTAETEQDSNKMTVSPDETQTETDKTNQSATPVEPEIIVPEEVNMASPGTSTDVTVPLTNGNTTEEQKAPEPLNSNFGDLDDLLQLLHDTNPLSPERLADLRIENIDFEVAYRSVQPSSKREGFATVPDVTWDDIGSLKEVREELQMAILAPVKHSDKFAAFGLMAPTGVLLCGPPGCGKTLLAKAIANEAEVNFISVKGPELLNMYVGESEKAVRQCFIRARNSAPCVIFFDELDALCPKRTEGDNSATSRVVNQVLTEMDGIEGRKGVYLMAATNRPDIIDPAVMRPGRFDKILYVGFPTPLDRVDILKAVTKNGTQPQFEDDVDLEAVGKSDKCDGYTGADLASLVREAGLEALKESTINNSDLTKVSMRHFDSAFTKIRPSVHEKEAKHYEKLQKLYGIKKQIVEPMETPVDTPMIDSSMEAMET
ncbi:Similar to NVL: Nuclear valosin-containing protein-like (Homo sapiens) [Cotesia congregata]|uniref:Similar to NVL: Nuclear valosin-containing protein-like (Homo sapiens) n=1 Tax=Cotesia congregata TaxID=51543 RepID=A0A8J2MTC3_COTCN|nr:Similar to NVL: Nuclear valosin-containing protein-like (Homo sapiens) [Cotesia congregata]